MADSDVLMRVPWNKGKRGIYSESTIEKMRKSKAGKPSPNKGRVFTTEHRRNLSKAHLGQVAWNKGIPIAERIKCFMEANHE